MPVRDPFLALRGKKFLHQTGGKNGWHFLGIELPHHLTSINTSICDVFESCRPDHFKKSGFALGRPINTGFPADHPEILKRQQSPKTPEKLALIGFFWP